MPRATGVETVHAIKKAAVWGTPVICGAGDGLYLLPHTLKKDQPFEKDNSLGKFHAVSGDYGSIKVEGDIPSYLRYPGLDLLIALAMGSTAGAPVQKDATAAYAQSFILADNLEDLFATFCVNNKVNIDEYPSVKVTGFVLKGESGKPLEISFTCLADDKVVNSAVNTLGTFASVTIPELKNRVLFSQGVLRMNDASDIALAAGDEIAPSSFELTYKLSQAGAYAAGQGDKIDEPGNTSAPEITLKLEFPRYTSNALQLDWAVGTYKKLDMVFTGDVIEGAYNYTFSLSFPQLAITNAEVAIEEGAIKAPLELICLGAETAPAGMTGITKPFQIDVINTETADVLA